MNSTSAVGPHVARRHFAFCVVFALLMSFPANAQRRPASGGSAAPATVSGPLAELAPSDTNLYIEMAGARSDAERAAVAELYTNITTGLGGLMSEPPLSLELFQMLAASNIAFSLRMPADSASSSSAGWLLIVRATSAANAATLAAKLTGLVGSPQPGAKASRVVTVRGRKVVPLSSSTSADSPCYCLAADSILMGDRASITRALGGSPGAASDSIAATELYRDGRARVGNDAGLFTLMSLPKEMFGKPEPAGAEPSMATLIGVQSLRGIVSGSEPWSPGAPGVTVVAIDQGTRNLLTILAGGPPVTLRTADLLPSDTGIVASFSLDLRAIESLFRSSKAAKDAGFDIAELDKRLGVSVRDQLLQAIGSEITVGIRFETPPASMTMGDDGPPQSSSPAPQLKTVVLVEVKATDAIRPALERAMLGAAAGEPTIRDVGGVRVAVAGRNAVAIADGVAIVGEPEEVERVLLGRNSEQTLGASHELDQARSRLDSDTIAIVHPTPALRDTMSTFASSLGMLVNASAIGLSNLDDTVVRREPLGIVVTTGGGSAFSVAAIGVIAAIAIPGLIQARGAANESAAIGTLRSLASAQATFHATQGRYGTMAELVAAEMIASDFRNGLERNGYVFREVRPTATTFEFSAAPVGPNSGGDSYNIIEDFVIRSSQTKTPPRRKAGKPVGQ